ncbi:hypothetical protein Hanom_Chr05g00424091 [Helianthus anomalus]
MLDAPKPVWQAYVQVMPNHFRLYLFIIVFLYINFIAHLTSIMVMWLVSCTKMQQDGEQRNSLITGTCVMYLERTGPMEEIPKQLLILYQT